MKKMIGTLSLITLVSCGDGDMISVGEISLDAAKICTGQTVAGIMGTANCSGGGPVSLDTGLYVFSSRNDLMTINMSDPAVLLDIVNGDINRSAGVATLSQVYNSKNFLNVFTARYQVIPNPVTDSDGRFNDNPQHIAKKHHLEMIVGRPDKECGTNPALSISQRIENCETENRPKAYYNGAQYGAAGEGDWKLVTRLSTGEEVWRDERTKLLWSDKAMGNPNAPETDFSHPIHGGYYNWYQASGYSKDKATSKKETGLDSEPGSGIDCWDGNKNVSCQPSNPISVCAEVDSATHKIIGGGADIRLDANYQNNPETAFKGNLGISQNVLWKIPSMDDYRIADANGLRKVLPKMDDMDASGNDLNSVPHTISAWYFFWSSSSISNDRIGAFGFGGSSGDIYYGDRSGYNPNFVRCVGFSHD